MISKSVLHLYKYGLGGNAQFYQLELDIIENAKYPTPVQRRV